MDNWQGCLNPQCQRALVNAREQVELRRGTVITVEDFLLALLDTVPSVSRFLVARGVDMDELVRTVQCEQPIVTEVGGEGLLSSQLLDWFATTRESVEEPWMDWPALLECLVRDMDRLQGKAYVAVLELVGQWPRDDDEMSQLWSEAASVAPLVVADPEWQQRADDVAVSLSATPNALVWLAGARGSGKSSWLRHLLAEPGMDFVQMDLRREAEVFASDLPVIPSDRGAGLPWPVLVLDNIAPVDLLVLTRSPASVAATLVGRWQGPMLLVGPDSGDRASEQELQSRLGRPLEVFTMPSCSAVQRLAIVTAHQGRIEKRWRVELPQHVLEFAVSHPHRLVRVPGGLLQWIERAAARLDMLARQGSAEGRALAGQVDTLRRQSLVALARREPVEEIERRLCEVEMERVATESSWQARKAAGTERRLSQQDLEQELALWVAAGSPPVHYDARRN